jgi:mannitol/fructose-specific phosphotransferase system IIA component (Ntr-type)
MPFVSRLRPEQIAIAPAWCGFDATVDGLLDRLRDAEVLSSGAHAEAAAAVRARESEGSTAVLEIGVGVPHARLIGLESPAVALAVSPLGLYEVAPSVPIRIVALVLSPVNAIDEHLRTLADIATLLRSTELRALLLRAATPAAALDVLVRFSRGLP